MATDCFAHGIRRIRMATIKRARWKVLGLLVAAFGCGQSLAARFHDGDTIFQTSRSVQSVAIKKATHSRYSHVGLIFLRGGKPYVYEAIGPVRLPPLKKWIVRGDEGHYVVKRRRDAGRIMTPQAIARLRRAAVKFKGKPYDFTFGWSDDRIFGRLA